MRRQIYGSFPPPSHLCILSLSLPAGLHLIRHAAWRTLERGGQFVLLGSAPDLKIQAGLPFLLS